jgi:hypothetical protein
MLVNTAQGDHQFGRPSHKMRQGYVCELSLFMKFISVAQPSINCLPGQSFDQSANALFLFLLHVLYPLDSFAPKSNAAVSAFEKLTSFFPSLSF